MRWIAPLITFVTSAALMAGCQGLDAGDPAVDSPAPAPVATRPAITPAPGTLIGVLNPAVTQATIGTTVCVKGWTATIRPPVSFTDALKVHQLPPGALPTAYEEDHLMPLELGGAPRDPANLKPVLWPRARLDDAWETRLHQELCAGEVTLAQAQSKITAIKRQP